MRVRTGKALKIQAFLLALFVFFVGIKTVELKEGDAEELTNEVILGGMTVGIKMQMDGLLVVGFSEIPSNGNFYSPGKNAGLKAGDIITEINGNPIADSNQLAVFVEECANKSFSITYLRNEKENKTDVTPVYYNDAGEYKIGVWVKDSVAGIGTLTFINPDTKQFAALGHGVSDSDTGVLVNIDDGSISGCSVSSVIKGERGYPGEIKGVFSGEDIGNINMNVTSGIYGEIKSLPDDCKKVITAQKDEVQEGDAVICSNVLDGTFREFSAVIERVRKQDGNDTKGLIIKVTDKELLAKTGGIVQGMSGSPIVQNGKLVGAVTHVFVNDPTRGYGIFIENMLSETKN